MVRLPVPGSDDGTWGEVLNEFLQVAHTSDGNLKNTGLIAQKADDTTVVHKAGAETITGAKDFTGGITSNGTALVGVNDTRLADQRTPLDNSVSSVKLQSNAVIAAKLADAAVISSKLAAGAATDGYVLTAASSQTSGMHWAQPTIYDTVRITGLVGDGVTNDAPTIQNVLNNLGTVGNLHGFDVLAEVPPQGIIYINSTVKVGTSNTRLRFGSPLRFGPNGRLRIYGAYEETPASNYPKLQTNGTAGSTTISVTDATPFVVGCYIVIRGQTDATGTAIQRIENSVTGISGTTLTLAEPLDSTYQVSYPTSDWPNDQTFVTRVSSAKITSAANRGDRTITVDSSSAFVAGNIVQIADDSTTTDNNGSAQPGNYTHRELAEVRQVLSATSIRLSHALHHSYDPTKNPRISKLLPITNSSIEDANVTWSGMSTVNAAFEMRFAVNCSIQHCVASGSPATSASWLNQAFRTSDSYMCLVDDCLARDPAVTGGGQGYGATLYGSTYCTVRSSRFSGNRHSILFYNGAAGNLVQGIISEDCRLSDYDLHGAECVDNLITDCIASGGESLPDDGSTSRAACKVGNPSHIEGDRYNTFSDIVIVNYQGAAFEVIPKSTNTVFKNCRVSGADQGIRMRFNANATTLVADDTFLSNIDFADIVTSIANVDGGASSVIHGLTFENCRFIRATGGVIINNASRVRLRNCSFLDPAQPAFTYGFTGSAVTQLTIKQNDFSNCQRGIKLGTCPSARITRNTMHDLGDTTVYEDAGGNNGTYFSGNDIFGFVPITRTSGSGPSASSVVRLYEAYAADYPARHGLLEWNYDPNYTNTTSALVSQTLYLLKISPQNSLTVSNIVMQIGTAGSGLTSGQNLAGIYDDTGARIAVSADQTTAWATNGTKTIAVGATNLTGMRDYYVAILSVGTTPPAVGRLSTSSGTVNVGLTSATQRQSVNGTAQTSLPSNLTLGSNSGTNTIGIWIGLS